MKKVHFIEPKPISKRANAKGVSVKGKHYLIGGLSPAGTETDIHELIITQQNSPNEFKAQWRPINIPNFKSVFTERNSFPACASNQKIYIYGGHEMTANGPICLKDLIEIDPESKTVKKIQAKGQAPPALNSSTIVYNGLEDSIVLFGGATDSGEPIPYIFTFLIKTGEWKKHKCDIPLYKQGIWMHTSHLSDTLFKVTEENFKQNSLHGHKVIGLDLGVGEGGQELPKQIKKIKIGEQPFEVQESKQEVVEQKKPQQQQHKADKQQPQGPYLIVIGGCSKPNEPYPYLSQISLRNYQLASHISLNPIVAHESNIYKGQIFIIGGSDGVGHVDNMTIVGQKVRIEKGITGIGSTSFVTEKGLVVYGGINAQSSSFNGWALIG